MKTEWTEYKNKMDVELALVESELKSIGQRKPGSPKDWEATPGNLDVSSADPNNAADRIEEYEDNTAILKQLEIRYNELKGALKKMEEGTYGVCEVSGEAIEADRLEANPAAKTCKAHM